MIELSGQIGKGYYKLSKLLRVPETERLRIENESVQNEDRCHKILSYWVNIHREQRAVLFPKLARVFRQMGKENLIDEMRRLSR